VFVHDHPAHVGVRPVELADGRPPLEGAQQDVLHDLLGQPGVAGDRDGEPQQRAVLAAQVLVELHGGSSSSNGC